MGVCRYVLLWLGSVQRGSAVKSYRSRLAIFDIEFFGAKFCVAVCCNVLQCVTVSSYMLLERRSSELQCVTV